MRKEDRNIWGIYLLIAIMIISIIVVLIVMLRPQPKNLTDTQIATYIQSIPEECRSIVQVKLLKKLAENGEPLHMSDLHTSLREIDTQDCRTLSDQLKPLQTPLP